MRACRERRFSTHDGVELFFRHCPARSTRPRGAIVMLHRGHEHSGRMDRLPGEFGLDDFAFYAWDARGHGRSPGARGDCPSFGTAVRDQQSFVHNNAAEDGLAVEDIAVLA
jgi:alpha-beta hydrolase superfamily lysophospholipase